MRSQAVPLAEPDPSELVIARERLQRQLNGGEITIETFSRAWRGLDRPRRLTQDRPDEVHLRRAGQLLSEFGTLWRNPAVPDRLREEALREIFERFDVDGAEIIAVHPQPNENAWLLGRVAAREQQLLPQRVMGLVGARMDLDLRLPLPGSCSQIGSPHLRRPLPSVAIPLGTRR